MVPSVGSTLSVKCLKCYYAQEVDQLFPVSPEDKINSLKHMKKLEENVGVGNFIS